MNVFTCVVLANDTKRVAHDGALLASVYAAAGVVMAAFFAFLLLFDSATTALVGDDVTNNSCGYRPIMERTANCASIASIAIL